LKLTRSGSTFTGYESADGMTWSQVGAVTLQLSATVNVGLVVTSHNNATLATAGFDNIALSAGSAPPPPTPTSTWTHGDIGGVGLAGSSEVNGTTITVRGSGADIWETADGFRFVYRAMTGDGEVRAQVASMSNTNPWAKAGVMIRESTASNARHTLACITAMNGSAVQTRTETGAAMSHTPGPWVTAPHWVRLVRTGNRITAYTSFDGATWTQGASQDVVMGATVLVGFAVTAHDNTQLNTAVFTNTAVQ
jgi:regulation of enolase protein 1 (concanavalin A-like superfamily)